MTPQEALDLLDSVVREINTTRAGHMKIQEAIAVLRAFLQPRAPQRAATP